MSAAISYRFGCDGCHKIFDATSIGEGDQWARTHEANEPTHTVNEGEVYPFPPNWRDAP